MDPVAPATVVAAYARRFHAAALATGPAHHVASPLGAWIVLALAAEALAEPTRGEAATHLGCSVEEAGAAARALLADPHPAVAAAVACWADPSRLGAHLAAWAQALPAPVERGPVPDQDGADRWAAERTGGLIERFPVAVAPETVLVLASALATSVTWRQPFDLADGSDLRGPWGDRLVRALTRAGDTRLADTDAAGLVVVTEVGTPDGLVVLTVSADPEVDPVDVLSAAHDLDRSGDATRSLFDVPLGAGHSWELTEAIESRATRTDRAEEATVVLPAWTATSTHPLLDDDGYGFAEVAARLLATLPRQPDGWVADATQAATATYDREGFEAAAVTAMALRGGGPPPEPRPVRVRTLRARHAHPHAVVAMALSGAWAGLPVFSAWVAEPAEPTG